MKLTDATTAFSGLSLEEKTEFLALLAHELTIVARDTYEVGGDGLVGAARMRSLNEVQHRLTATLVALLRNDPARYPDDVLVQIIVEHPGDAQLQEQIADAFRRALALTGAAA